MAEQNAHFFPQKVRYLLTGIEPAFGLGAAKPTANLGQANHRTVGELYTDKSLYTEDT